jgi:hypothetical protein
MLTMYPITPMLRLSFITPDPQNTIEGKMKKDTITASEFRWNIFKKVFDITHRPEKANTERYKERIQ